VLGTSLALNPHDLLDRGFSLSQFIVTAGLYDGATEVLKTAAMILAVVLPALGAVWATKRENTKADKPSVGAAGMVAIAGAVASSENAKLYVEEFQRVTAAIDRLTCSQTQTAEAYELAATRWKIALDEMEGMRRALDDIAHHYRRGGHSAG
jgi:hypothetical protein